VGSPAETRTVVARAVATRAGRWRLRVVGRWKPSTVVSLGAAKRRAEETLGRPLRWRAVEFESEWVATYADRELLQSLEQGDDVTSVEDARGDPDRELS
jgi:hypothetical protein